MRYLLRTVLALMLLATVRAYARDAYLIRFDAPGRYFGCGLVYWRDEALFYNNGSAAALVRILGVSNARSPFVKSPDSFIIPARSGTVLHDAIPNLLATRAWIPAPLFTLHLDVPDTVSVESHDQFYIMDTCSDVRRAFFGSRAHASMPVFTKLTPPGIPQVHLGTDLGENDSRTNVVIYNAGPVPATAHIELRKTCDDHIVDSRTVTIDADTTIQVNGLIGDRFRCSKDTTSYWSHYTIVTVDQPSLSMVSNITESQGDFYTGKVPTVDLAVAHQLSP